MRRKLQSVERYMRLPPSRREHTSSSSETVTLSNNGLGGLFSNDYFCAEHGDVSTEGRWLPSSFTLFTLKVQWCHIYGSVRVYLWIPLFSSPLSPATTPSNRAGTQSSTFHHERPIRTTPLLPTNANSANKDDYEQLVQNEHTGDDQSYCVLW